jgi:hypothetical protein
MKTFSLIALALISTGALAQKAPGKFGDIPMADLTMKTYGKDSSASAVVLFDFGNAYISDRGDDYILRFERHVRIKVLKKDGLSQADIFVPLYHSGSSEEKITGLKAVTYNLESGKIVETKMSKEGVFKEKFNKYVNHQKFTLPGVKEGSVFEYSYNLESDFFTSFPNWKFQVSIPTRHSEYWAMIPESFDYQRYMQGYITTEYELKPTNIAGISVNGFHWIAKDVPAFREEPYMTSEVDYVSKINFALSTYRTSNGVTREVMGSWQTLSENLMQDEGFGKVIAKSGFLKETAISITAGKSEPLEKIKAIHSYVKENIEWDGEKDFLAGDLKKVMEKKKGTSGDINLMLASLLDKAGFDVNMILLSTRDHGFVRQQYPMTRQFNYVICAVKLPDRILLLDATDRYLPMTVLPERCLNGQGLIVSKLDRGWIDITTKVKAKTTTSGDFVLSETGELKGTLSFARDGYQALSMRKAYFDKGEEAYLRDVKSGKPWGIEKSEFADLTDLDKSAKEKHSVTITEQGTAAGDVLYINPIVTHKIQENPFKLDQRIYPVDFGIPVENIYLCKITIPAGYQVDELPQSKVFALPGNAARFTYSAVPTGNIINITCNLSINKALFVQSEYPVLKEFYTQVIAKQEEQIVLKKKP